jgi:hypothetical protein
VRNICGVSARQRPSRGIVTATRDPSARLSVSATGSASRPPTSSCRQASMRRSRSSRGRQGRAASCTSTQSASSAGSAAIPARTESARSRPPLVVATRARRAAGNRASAHHPPQARRRHPRTGAHGRRLRGTTRGGSARGNSGTAWGFRRPCGGTRRPPARHTTASGSSCQGAAGAAAAWRVGGAASGFATGRSSGSTTW